MVYFILRATLYNGINPLWVQVLFYPGRKTLSVSYWWITHWVLAWLCWGYCFCWSYYSNKEGVRRESGENFKWKIPDVKMRALTAQWITYIHECEMWFSLAVSCWSYFILLNRAHLNDSLLVCMPFFFVHTSASRSIFVEVMPRFSYKVMHFETQLYSDR